MGRGQRVDCLLARFGASLTGDMARGIHAVGRDLLRLPFLEVQGAGGGQLDVRRGALGRLRNFLAQPHGRQGHSGAQPP